MKLKKKKKKKKKRRSERENMSMRNEAKKGIMEEQGQEKGQRERGIRE